MKHFYKDENMQVRARWTMRDIFLIILCMGVLSGCASMSKEECKTANWETVGFSDGSNGGALLNIRQHQKACAGVVTPDLDAYTRGHVRGVKNYCTASTGYNAGVRGYKQNSICSGSVGAEYQTAYQYGINVHNAKDRVKHLTKDLQAAHQAKADAEYEIKVIEAALVSSGLTTSERTRLLNDSKDLQAALPDYDGPIIEIEHELGVAVDAVNDLYQNNSFAKNKPISMPGITVVTRPDPKPASRGHQHEEHAGDRRESDNHSGYTHRPLRKKVVKTFGKVVERQMQNQCRTRGKGRFNKKRITRAINGALKNSYLGEFNCAVNSIDGSICNNAGNHWYTSMACDAEIEGKEKVFGLTHRCKKKRGKKKHGNLQCSPVKDPNMSNIHRKEVRKEIGKHKFRTVKKCFAMKRGPGRAQHGNDNFSRCFSKLMTVPDESVCSILGNTEDYNPSLSDMCYLTLARRSRDAYFCDQIVWSGLYEKCRKKIKRH